MNPVEIRRNIVDGVYKLTNMSEVKRRTMKSPVWNFMCAIFDESNNLIDTHVCCRMCKIVLKYTVSDNNTTRKCSSNLTKHMKSCSKNRFPKATASKYSVNSSAMNFFASHADHKNYHFYLVRSEKSAPTVSGYNSILSASHKNMMLNAATDFLVDDMRPAYALEGQGLRKLLSTFSTIHMAYQPVELEDVSYFLPSRNTVMENVSTVADEIRELIMEEMQKVFGQNGPGGAISLDLWTDGYQQKAYMGMMLHYVNDDGIMIQRTLANEPLPSDKKKDSAFILLIVETILMRFGIILDEVKGKLVFVTDRASYFLKAFENYGHITCVLHFFSNAVQKIFEEGRPKEVLAACTKAVGFVKRSSRNDQFHPTLKSLCEVRWNSAVLMMQSIVANENFTKLEEILRENNRLNILVDVTLEELKSLIAFTEVFLAATKSMETTSKPTLFLVMAWYEKIDKTIQLSTEDTLVVRSAKENIGGYYLITKIESSRYLRSKYHKMSVFLHPAMKTMAKFSPNEKEETMQYVSSGLFQFRFSLSSIHCKIVMFPCVTDQRTLSSNQM